MLDNDQGRLGPWKFQTLYCMYIINIFQQDIFTLFLSFSKNLFSSSSSSYFVAWNKEKKTFFFTQSTPFFLTLWKWRRLDKSRVRREFCIGLYWNSSNGWNCLKGMTECIQRRDFKACETNGKLVVFFYKKKEATNNMNDWEDRLPDLSVIPDSLKLAFSRANIPASHIL